MIVIVAGGRDFNDYPRLKGKLDAILYLQESPTIMSGMARGADSLAVRYAAERGLALIERPADWLRNGRRAGFMRNETMAQEADSLVAFWDGHSRGTQHMIETMRRLNKPVRVISY